MFFVASDAVTLGDCDFINNAHFFLLTCIFYFRKYLITVLLCSPLYFSTIASQGFGRFVILFRVPLLFCPRMAWVTAAETSSREEKQCPRIGSFNLCNKLKPGGLMS
jgi:hypothetical protein